MKRVSKIADTFYDSNSVAEVNFTRSSKKGNESEKHNDKFETVANPMDPRFTESARDEIQGLLSRGSFKIDSKENIPENSIVVKSRVHHVIKKNENGNKKYKTRLVIQGHKDPDKGSIVTEAPTVLPSSLRLLLSIAAMCDFEVWSRDVKQAFIQSSFPIDREIYIKPPKKPNLMAMIGEREDRYLMALKPIYGLTESPGYWWQTFKNYRV